MARLLLERSRELAMRIYAWARYHAVVTLAHVQSNPFYHPFYPDVTHVRKDTRPSPAFNFLYCKRWKAGRGLGTRLICDLMVWSEGFGGITLSKWHFGDENLQN